MAGLVSNLGEGNGGALHQEVLVEQPPVVISLIKVNSSNGSGDITNEDLENRELSRLKLPRGYLSEIFVMAEELPVEFTKAVFWSKPVNFIIPDDCVASIMKWEEEKRAASGLWFLPLEERLQGWVIEKRPRESNVRHDKYFYHTKSDIRFRSFLEVETFLLHGRFPKPLEHSGSKSSKRKRTTEAICEITENQKKLVEEFLEESWKNLLKTGRQRGGFPLCRQ